MVNLEASDPPTLQSCVHQAPLSPRNPFFSNPILDLARTADVDRNRKELEPQRSSSNRVRLRILLGSYNSVTLL